MPHFRNAETCEAFVKRAAHQRDDRKTPEWGIEIMNEARDQAEKLLCHCFTQEQFEFPRVNPEFIEVRREIKSLTEAIHAVEVGDGILNRSSHLVSVALPFPCSATQVAFSCFPGAADI